MSSVESFFSFARERHAIHLRRRASLPAPWTEDPILQTYRFTNVFRQLDRTTEWYTENVRKKVSPKEILLATVVFRWFNRITTGEAIWDRLNFWNNSDHLHTAWEAGYKFDSNDRVADVEWIDVLRQSIRICRGDGPYVTGAYIIKTPDGYNKLDGVLKCIEWFMEQRHDYPGDVATASQDYRDVSELLLASKSWADHDKEACFGSLEQTWEWLRKFPFLGDFMAYEIVTDLRWSILDWAPDIMTWANPGPGATRGIGRVFESSKDAFNQHRDKAGLITNMRILLDYSRDAGFWPQQLSDSACTKNCEYDERFQTPGDWPVWEMRDVEHTLCEMDKYERVRNGEGRPRGRFR